MARQEGGELNSFPDLPPAKLPADLASAAEAGAAARRLGVRPSRPGRERRARSRRRRRRRGDRLRARRAGLLRRPGGRWPPTRRRPSGAYRAEHVFSAVKHFPGLGAADQSTEEGPATVGLGLDELRARDLMPFEAAFDEGVPAVVISHALYAMNDFTVPASLSTASRDRPAAARAPLQRRGDHRRPRRPGDHLVHTVPDAAIQALRAGADMLYISGPPATSRPPTSPCCAPSSAAASRAAGSTRPWAASCWRSRTTT